MESFEEVFNTVKKHCMNDLSEVSYNTWINPIKPVSFNDDTAVLSCKSSFQKDIISSKYLELLEKGFKDILGFNVSVSVITEEAPEPEEGRDFISALADESNEHTDINSLANAYKFSFNTFIVGNSNKFAYAACMAVAKKPVDTAYNPLFLYGPSGLGKTHLLMAISNEIKKTYEDKNIVYVNGETFTNEIIAAIQNKTTPEFHKKYRSADVLLVDDVQFIAGKESTQEEFFHTFKHLYDADKQIVLTSDRPVKEINILDDRLRNRFEGGIFADISPPDFETRTAIVKRKAELLNIAMPDDVAEFISNKIKNNIRQLEGAVKKISAHQTLIEGPITVPAVQSIIRDILSENQPIPVTIDRIINEVSRTLSVSPDDIKSQKRSAQVSLARQSCAYIIREITGLALAKIGAEFGGRDHATIVYCVQAVERRMAKDSSFKGTIEDIIKNIRSN